MNKEVTIKVDGKDIKALEGRNLLDVLLENGFEVPYLCYHKKLSPTGACRLCVTKIKGQRGLVPSCAVNITDGMEVTAFDDELEDARKHTLDYLLAEHNEASDNTYADEFLTLIKRYGLDKPENRSFPSMWQSINQHIDDSSPVLTYDSSKCVKCFRCIKGCSEVQGKGVLSFSDRGINSYIIAGLDKWSESECDGCGECVQLCPTGAIVEKPNRNVMNLDKIEKKVRTTCPYCGVGCQLEYWVQDGKIVRATGVEGAMPNDGRLCVKGRFGYEFINSPERLTKPLIKKNGKFVESTWDEALDLIATKFNEIKDKYGNDALCGYASARCTNEDNYLFQKFIRVVFGTNNMDYCTRLCHASTVTAMLKSIGSGAASGSIQDYEQSDCTFVIGNNIVETHPITATYLKRGKLKGRKIVVVDPKWTPLVKYADVWLQEKLGTDVPLLNGLMNVIIENDWIDREFIEKRVEGGMKTFEELKRVVSEYTPERVEEITGVPAEKLKKAAKIYATSRNSMIATGMGMSQQVVGTNSVFALLNMMLITGQVGRDLAGISPPRGQNNVQGATDVGCSPIYYPGYVHSSDDENRKKLSKLWNVKYEDLPSQVGLSLIEIMNAVHDGKIKGMFIMGENPLHTDPNLNHTEEAIKKLDFLVAIDIFPTLTTQHADVILPASALAEKTGSVVSSDRRVLRIKPAVKSPGECREDWKIIVDIANRMGVSIGNYKDASEIFNEITEACSNIMSGISYERLESEELQWPCISDESRGVPTLFKETFNTPNGKGIIFPVHFMPENNAKISNEYPLLLNTGRILYQYHSATMSRKCKPLNNYADSSYVLIHPNDAKKFCIKDGDKVKLSSKQGEITTIAKLESGVNLGEVFMPWHFNESLPNKLTRSDLDPMSKIAGLKYTPCKIEKI